MTLFENDPQAAPAGRTQYPEGVLDSQPSLHVLTTADLRETDVWGGVGTTRCQITGWVETRRESLLETPTPIITF